MVVVLEDRKCSLLLHTQCSLLSFIVTPADNCESCLGSTACAAYEHLNHVTFTKSSIYSNMSSLALYPRFGMAITALNSSTYTRTRS